MVKKALLFFFILGCISPLFAQVRSFDDLFPGFDRAKKEQVFSSGGLIYSAQSRAALQLLPAAEPGFADIAAPVLNRNPSFLVESLAVIPGGGKEADILDLYNALRNVRALKGRLYHSASRDEAVPLFEDATRIEGPKKTSPIPDPLPARSVPREEQIFIRLKDVNFGNSYYRADISTGGQGLLYCLSNFKTLSYLFIPVMKEGKFAAQIYLEPLAEGVLVYSLAGADVSDFVASRVNIPSAIRKRLEVIIDWVTDGIKAIP